MGRSMEPLIRQGAKLVINMSPSEYALGDVVLFSRHNKLSAHRIISSTGKTVKKYLTKGDNNSYVDEWLSKKSLIGRIEAIVYPSYTITLHRSLTLSSCLFLLYSWATLCCPWLLRWDVLTHVSLFKKLYRLIVTSDFSLTAFRSH